MTATLHLPPSVCMCVCVYVCVCEWECETGIEICAQGQSTDLPVFFLLFRCVLWFLFLFWKESKDQKLRCKFSLLSTQNLRKLPQTMRTKRMGKRDWREREVKSLERKQRRRKLKAIFNFLSWRKLKNLLQPPAQQTLTNTHLHLHTQRQIEIRVPLFKNSKKLRASVAQLTERLFIANSCCNYKNYAALTALLLRPQ